MRKEFIGGVGLLVAVTGCGTSDVEQPLELGTVEQALTSSVIQHVFVIAMENHDASQIYGNTTNAPYINGTLMPAFARATSFGDPLALSIPSEPHYVFMEAG